MTFQALGLIEPLLRAISAISHSNAGDSLDFTR